MDVTDSFTPPLFQPTWYGLPCHLMNIFSLYVTKFNVFFFNFSKFSVIALAIIKLYPLLAVNLHCPTLPTFKPFYFLLFIDFSSLSVFKVQFILVTVLCHKSTSLVCKSQHVLKKRKYFCNVLLSEGPKLDFLSINIF